MTTFRRYTITWTNRCLTNDSARQLLLEKGVYVRPPYMVYPKEVEFIERQSFLTGWFGPRRPLLAIEVAHLFTIARNNEIGKATLTAFAQVTGGNSLCKKAKQNRNKMESNGETKSVRESPCWKRGTG